MPTLVVIQSAWMTWVCFPTLLCYKALTILYTTKLNVTEILAGSFLLACMLYVLSSKFGFLKFGEGKIIHKCIIHIIYFLFNLFGEAVTTGYTNLTERYWNTSIITILSISFMCSFWKCFAFINLANAKIVMNAPHSIFMSPFASLT